MTDDERYRYEEIITQVLARRDPPSSPGIKGKALGLSGILALVLSVGGIGAGIYTVGSFLWVPKIDMAHHEALVGHPIMVERVQALQSDVGEIKADMKDLKRGVEKLLARGK